MYLENLKPIETLISHGNLGTNGDMGYQIIPSVNGQNFHHIVSAHASSIIKYELNQQYNSFNSYIGLNDSSSDQAVVEFQVICDGEIKYNSSKVRKFQKIRSVDIDISGTNILELRCLSQGDPVAHSLWIDPVCSENKIAHHIGPFNNTFVDLDFEKRKSKFASVVFATGNMSGYLYAFLKTFQKNSKLEDCVNYIVIEEESFVIRKIAKLFNAVVIKTNKTNNYKNKTTVDIKDSTYTVIKFINAEYFIVSDIDIIVKKDLREAFVEDKIGICRDLEENTVSLGELVSSEWSAYRGNEECLRLLKFTEEEINHLDIFNCGVITGNKKAFMILEDELKKMLPESQFYLCFNNGAGPREQALINLALIRANNYHILELSYNQQLLWLPVIENACLHLNAPETKKVYKHLVEKECDDAFEALNRDLFEDYIHINKFKNIFCIGNLDFPNKVANNDWVSLKEMANKSNSFDCLVYDHFDDLPNTKIKLHLINQILNKGKIVILTSKENLVIFDALEIEYELLGRDFGREILVINK